MELAKNKIEDNNHPLLSNIQTNRIKVVVFFEQSIMVSFYEVHRSRYFPEDKLLKHNLFNINT